MRMTRSLSLLQPPRQPDGPQCFPSSVAGVSLPSPPPSPQNPPPASHSHRGWPSQAYLTQGVAIPGPPHKAGWPSLPASQSRGGRPGPASHRGWPSQARLTQWVAIMGLPYGVPRWDSGPSARWRSLAWNPPTTPPRLSPLGPPRPGGRHSTPQRYSWKAVDVPKGLQNTSSSKERPRDKAEKKCQQQSPWSSPCEPWNQMIRIAWPWHVPNSGKSFPHLQNGDRVTDHRGL